MKNTKRTVAVILFTCILGAVFLFAPKYIFATVKNAMDSYENQQLALEEDHWVYNNTGRKFVYHDGVVIRNTWREVDGTRYYFDEDGYVKTGWVHDKGKTYYLKENGTPESGWIQPEEKGDWYYLDKNGIPQTGWIQDGDKWYYLQDDGTMVTGWHDVEDTSYYFNNDGSMASGWIDRDGNTYYLSKSGTITIGWKKIDDTWYYFREDGAMMIGWITADGEQYFLDADGHMVTNAWQEKDGETYFLGSDGTVQTGWVTVDGKKYFLNSDGTLASKGWIEYGGKRYYLDENGSPVTGWLKLKNKWYYLNEDGSMATGWITVDGKKYYMKKNGVWDKKKTVPATKVATGAMVALTFDDGPGKYTERILNTLSANGAKATFFMLGQNVSHYPDAVRKMSSLGCELANHTYDHTDLSTLDAAGVQNEVNSTNSQISSLVGHGASLVRPPYGAYNETTTANVGFPMILWSIDTLDWKTKDVKSTYDAAMDAQDGDIILMHDIHEPTADAVDLIVPALKAKGFQMVTVSELAAAKGISLGNGGTYGSLR